jgi:diguanylate cyclase (GGDEF)-like protein
MIKPTDQTLIEQMRITEFDIEHRKMLILLSNNDIAALISCKPAIEKQVDDVIDSFYSQQTSIPEIALLIGDADTLQRLKAAQRRYILDLFSGLYDLEYVNNRCRIGLVHKRIGVEPQLYLSGVLCLKELLRVSIDKYFTDEIKSQEARIALDKLLMFDITLVFETYIRSLVTEIETAKAKSDHYALSLEEKVRARTQQFNELARHDPLTSLLNTRDLNETLIKAMRSAQRQHEPITVVYMDVNDFKVINDTDGHQRGDEVLQAVGHAIKGCARLEDYCFRYGGDEFFVILTNCTAQQARDIYVAVLEKKMQILGVSLSIGIAETGPTHFIDEALLIKQADENMYLTKQAHKAAKLAKTDVSL